MNPVRAYVRWRHRRWNRNIIKLIATTERREHGSEATTLSLWERFPGWSIYRLHAFIDAMEHYGYVTTRQEQGGSERRYMMRRLVKATDTGLATCRQGPPQNVSTYQLVAKGRWLCWNHLSEAERRECIR